MLNDSTIELTIEFTDPDLNSETLDQEVRWLERQLQPLDGIECSRVPAPASPEETKGGVGPMILGILTTKISLAFAQSCIQNIFDLVRDKPIEVHVKFSDGTDISYKVYDRKGAGFAMESIHQILESHS